MKNLLLLISIISTCLVGCKDEPATQSSPGASENTVSRVEKASESENLATPSISTDSTNPSDTDSLAGPGREQDLQVYHGTSDASAAVMLNRDLFVMADDENNILRVYKIGRPSPVYSRDLTGFLRTEDEHPEADIEGAAKVGNRVYWITSHGRNKDGKPRPNRYRFFATDIDVDGEEVKIYPVGVPCLKILAPMLTIGAIRDLNVHKAAGLGFSGLSEKDMKKLAPKKEGLNIEGLCASVDGNTLYIGFRNPRPLNKSTGRNCALVVPLKNPAQVVEQGDTPIFGDPMLWDLAGLGIRSMEYSAFNKAYFIVAGAFDETRNFALYRWSGREDDQPELLRNMSQSTFGPEALAPFEQSGVLFLLSDDGTLPINVSNPSECMEDELNPDGTCPNKFLLDPDRKTFRALRLAP